MVFTAPMLIGGKDAPGPVADIGSSLISDALKPLIVTVARSGLTRQAAFEQMIELLPREKLIGAFLNDSRWQKHVRRFNDELEDERETLQ